MMFSEASTVGISYVKRLKTKHFLAGHSAGIKA